MLYILFNANVFRLKPRFKREKPSKVLNNVLYAHDSPCLLVGDNDGCVDVLKPVGLEWNMIKNMTHDEQERRLLKAILDNTTAHQ